jgi:signal transduction histidine kinase
MRLKKVLGTGRAECPPGGPDDNPASAFIWRALESERGGKHGQDSDRRLAADPIEVTSAPYTQEQLCHSQTMESLGMSTTRMAHDLNSLLTVIIGFSDLIRLDDAPVAPIAEKLSQIRKAADQGAALTRQILDLARHRVVPRVDEEHKKREPNGPSNGVEAHGDSEESFEEGEF